MSLLVARLVAERLSGHMARRDSLGMRSVAKPLQLGFDVAFFFNGIGFRHRIERCHLPPL